MEMQKSYSSFAFRRCQSTVFDGAIVHSVKGQTQWPQFPCTRCLGMGAASQNCRFRTAKCKRYQKRGTLPKPPKARAEKIKSLKQTKAMQTRTSQCIALRKSKPILTHMGKSPTGIVHALSVSQSVAVNCNHQAEYIQSADCQSYRVYLPEEGPSRLKRCKEIEV